MQMQVIKKKKSLLSNRIRLSEQLHLLFLILMWPEQAETGFSFDILVFIVAREGEREKLTCTPKHQVTTGGRGLFTLEKRSNNNEYCDLMRQHFNPHCLC